MLAYRIFSGIITILNLLDIAILVYWIVTWVAPQSSLRWWLQKLLNPFCAPFAPLAQYCIRRWGAPFDFTLLFTILGIRVAERLLTVLYRLIL